MGISVSQLTDKVKNLVKSNFKASLYEAHQFQNQKDDTSDSSDDNDVVDDDDDDNDNDVGDDDDDLLSEDEFFDFIDPGVGGGGGGVGGGAGVDEGVGGVGVGVGVGGGGGGGGGDGDADDDNGVGGGGGGVGDAVIDRSYTGGYLAGNRYSDDSSYHHNLAPGNGNAPQVAPHAQVQPLLHGMGDPDPILGDALFTANGDYNNDHLVQTGLRVWRNQNGEVTNNGIASVRQYTHGNVRCALCGFKLVNEQFPNEVVKICHATPRLATMADNVATHNLRMLCHYACHFSQVSNYNLNRSMACRVIAGQGWTWAIPVNRYDTPSDPLLLAGANPPLIWKYMEVVDLIVGVKIIAGRNNANYNNTLGWGLGGHEWMSVYGICPILQCTGKSVADMHAHWLVVGPHRNTVLQFDFRLL